VTVDDLFLRAQRGVDRLIRRLRLGPPPAPGRRRLLIVQIDGLSRAVLDQALAGEHMPVLQRLVTRKGHRLTPMTAGIPTSTPAFQMAAMYGVEPDIPGFHYHDKRRRTDIHFPRAGHAAFVEADQAAGRPGILSGGSVYGCVFTGGAVNDFFSFSRLTRPRAAGLLRVLSAAVVLGWVAMKCVVLTGHELLRLLGRIARRPRQRREAWKLAKKRIAISVWTREWFTCAVLRDVYDGVPAIYLNYLDHDEVAHALGPRSHEALTALRGIDRSLRQIRRVLRRVPEYRYDLFVLADHGQAPCAPYRTVAGGQRFERAFFEQVLGWGIAEGTGEASPAAPPGPVAAPAWPGAGAGAVPGESSGAGPGLPQELGFEPYLDERESHEQQGVRVVSAGPNAFVYFVDTPEPVPLERIEARFPGLPATLSKSAGVGLVLARSADGPVSFWRGQAHLLANGDDDGPFAKREDRESVKRDLARLMAMPSAGDLVVYGIDAPEGHVSYIDEVGGHAGASPDELHTFVVAPEDAGFPARIDHPLQLHEVFMRYQRPADTSAP
jgi:hypothetical protein